MDIRKAAARDEIECPLCHDTGGVCGLCVARYKLQVERRRAAARLSGGERVALVLLGVFLVFLAAVFQGNREIAQVAAYGLIIGAGGVAAWSLGRSLW